MNIFERIVRSFRRRRPGGPSGAPGESGPGEPGYDGRVTVGEEGAAMEDEASEESFPASDPPTYRGRKKAS